MRKMLKYSLMILYLCLMCCFVVGQQSGCLSHFKLESDDITSSKVNLYGNSGNKLEIMKLVSGCYHDFEDDDPIRPQIKEFLADKERIALLKKRK